MNKETRMNNMIASKSKRSKAGRAHGVAVLLAALLLMISATAGVFAGSVSYEGEAEGFVFTPGSSSSPTDLFSNFSDVMPGDSLTEEIEVRNNSDETRTIYMRALAPSDADKDFLSQLQMKVSSSDGDTVFDSTADQTAGLTDWVDIGSYASGSSKKLSVEITVPIEMGNDYQNAAGDVKWQFMTVEESEDDPAPTPNPNPNPNPDPDNPADSGKTGGGGAKTGDETNLALPIIIVAAAAAGLVIIRRRRKSE